VIKKEESKLFSLVEIAFASADAKENFGMKIGDHKLICSVLNGHMDEIDTNNEQFRESLIDDVREVIQQELAPITKELKAIKMKIDQIDTKIKSHEQRINEIETRLDDYYIRLKKHQHE